MLSSAEPARLSQPHALAEALGRMHDANIHVAKFGMGSTSLMAGKEWDPDAEASHYRRFVAFCERALALCPVAYNAESSLHYTT